MKSFYYLCPICKKVKLKFFGTWDKIDEQIAQIIKFNDMDFEFKNCPEHQEEFDAHSPS